MKVKLDKVKKVYIHGDFIRLDSLLKFSAIASTGGEAKYVITSGNVFVDKELCTQRGRKIRPGSIVAVCGNTLLIKGNS